MMKELWDLMGAVAVNGVVVHLKPKPQPQPDKPDKDDKDKKARVTE